MTGIGPGSPASVPVPAAGVRIGVDVGTVRVGVAVSDPGGVLATPLVTLARDNTGARGDLDRIAALVRERHAVEVVVGLPRSLSGKRGPAARSVEEYVEELTARVNPVPVRLVDERLTTVVATRNLARSGIRGRKGRSVVDQEAAVLILQGWLDAVRTSR